MSVASGYTPGQVMPFVLSLRSSGYQGAVVLFGDRAFTTAFREEARRLGVRLVRIPRWRSEIVGVGTEGRLSALAWRCLRGAGWMSIKLASRVPAGATVRLALEGAVAERLYFPMASRFFRYRRFLRAHTFERILLADVRDVFFQRDPFREIPPDGLYVSLETRSYTLGTEPHNAEWMRLAYGEEALARIGSNPVSCAGVTCGERMAIERYLELMIGEIRGLPLRKVRLAGLDQAMHNLLLWSGRLTDVRMLETLGSAVATLNGVSPEEARVSPDGRLMNRDGSEPSVVHQYDRVEGLRGALLRTLPSC